MPNTFLGSSFDVVFKRWDGWMKSWTTGYHIINDLLMFLRPDDRQEIMTDNIVDYNYPPSLTYSSGQDPYIVLQHFYIHAHDDYSRTLLVFHFVGTRCPDPYTNSYMQKYLLFLKKRYIHVLVIHGPSTALPPTFFSSILLRFSTPSYGFYILLGEF